MPRICEFYGIVISMYFDDHGIAHFHATYAEYDASFAIDPLDMIEGDLPRRARSLVLEWAALHRIELLQNWQRARQRQELARIDPLN
jgi:hypothetical protein